MPTKHLHLPHDAGTGAAAITGLAVLAAIVMFLIVMLVRSISAF